MNQLIVLLCRLCGGPFRTDRIRDHCPTCNHGQPDTSGEVSGA